MTEVVIDASTALAWCFPDESSDYADSVLVALERKTILVPAVWSLEVANAVLVGERHKRLRQPEILRFTTLLESLSVLQDVQPVGDHVKNVLPLAREYSLSAYEPPPISSFPSATARRWPRSMTGSKRPPSRQA